MANAMNMGSYPQTYPQGTLPGQARRQAQLMQPPQYRRNPQNAMIAQPMMQGPVALARQQYGIPRRQQMQPQPMVQADPWRDRLMAYMASMGYTLR